MASPKAAVAGLSCNSSLPSADIDQLIGTFSANPSLISFAQVCGDRAWENRQVFVFGILCPLTLILTFYLH